MALKPSTANMPTQRQQFEAWAKSQSLSLSTVGDRYIHADTASAWRAWQAAQRCQEDGK